MNKAANIFWGILIFILILVGSASLLIFSRSYDSAKAVFDSFSRDGNFQSFTFSVFSTLKLPAMILGGVSLFTGLFFAFLHQRSIQWIEKLFNKIAWAWRKTLQDFQELFSTYRLTRKNAPVYGILAGITLFSALARLVFISRAMGHDECYTYLTFAELPLKYALSDYSVPNNHIFHTVLVHLSTGLLGNYPWSVRLPAFLAGVLAAPCTYILARKHYDSTSALLAASLVAAYPLLIQYSTSARGYTLLALFTLLIFICGTMAKSHKNLAAWFLLIVFSALGMFTIPIMLYPLGALFTWLFLSTLIGDFSKEYTFKNMILYILIAGIGTIFLTLLLYTPAFRYSGVDAIIGNGYVSAQGQYLELLASRWIDLKNDWMFDLPAFCGILLWIGFGASLVLHRSITRQRFPISIAALLFIAVELFIQRPNPWSRLWQAFLPLFLIWVAAGWMGLLRTAQKKLSISHNLPAGAAYIGVGILVAATVFRSFSYYPTLIPTPEEEEQTAIYLNQNLSAGDVVFVEPPRDEPVIYYLFQHQTSPEYLQRNQPFQQVYIVVDLLNGQTLDSVIQYNGDEPFLLDLDSSVLAAQFDHIQIYRVQSNWERMKKEYQLD